MSGLSGTANGPHAAVAAGEEKRADEGGANPTMKTGRDDEDTAAGNETEDEPTGLSPEQEAELLAAANAHKAEANAHFGHGRTDAALTAYEAAAAVLPAHHDYDLAVLRSNMAACHLKMEAWKEAVTAATQALDALEREKREKEGGEKEKEEKEGDKKEEPSEDEVEEEIISAGASKAAPIAKAALTPAQMAARDRERIRAKVLLRRGRARAMLGGWSNLSGAEEDYRALAALEPDSTALTAADRRLIQTQLRQLPARTKAAQEAEMGEMWGKLKELGNGILRPFGMSTDNFKMVRDEKTGGYSMNFQQGS
ncbi:tetratricopeptide repeat protein 1 [Grosmannia clavigera kw1407]|uniref:Tetratricopeptide repeat protein 1 n=1 Tax=Grosmannia clavigera (strain kw1407 / UAMH 11150) TaxID=655863 RepID=F0XSN9_GROCL|nr:tetratricopeptide repeat protein 1 [Grosmannia clavigera kw1407]EFW99356.1 tetratricopeptide repeat protein 1 [Grosmannia clavigera kw1407]